MRVCCRHRLNFVGDAAGPEPFGDVFMNATMRSGSGNGTDFSRTVLTTEKIAVFAPIPSVSAAMAATVNPGVCRNMRSECLRSRKKVSMRASFLDVLDGDGANPACCRTRCQFPDRRARPELGFRERRREKRPERPSRAPRLRRRSTGSDRSADPLQSTSMNRRDFICRSGLASAGLALSRRARLLAQSEPAERWRMFEIATRVEVLQPSDVTRVWLPTPLAVAPSQKTMGDTYRAVGGRAVMIETNSNEPDILGAEWEDGNPAVLTLTSRVTTRDHAAELTAPTVPPPRDLAAFAHFLRPTRLIPIDGI